MEGPAFYVDALSPPRTVRRCVVCGFHEVRTDEVVDRGLILLTECPRCEHRATEAVVSRAAPVRASRPDGTPLEEGSAAASSSQRRRIRREEGSCAA